MKINPQIPGTLTRIAVGNVDGPQVSGDGKTIVYDVFEKDRWHVMRWRDGKTDAITDDPHSDTEVQLDDAGDAIVWSRYSKVPASTDGGHYDVMQWRDGLTSTVAGTPADQTDPAISGDGKVLAWTWDDPSKPTGFDIQEQIDGKIENVTTGWPVDTEPIANRDGSRIFFRRKIQYDDGDMWMWDRASGALKQLTDTPWKENDPVIDAQGKTLVWSTEASGNDQLLRLDVDKGTTTVVAAEPGVNETHAALSADASIIAWQRQKPNEAPQIYLQQKGSTIPLTLDGWNAFPSMSRDGKVLSWIAIEPDGNTALYRFERS